MEPFDEKYTLTKNWNNPDFKVPFNTMLLKDEHFYSDEARLGKLYCLDVKSVKTCCSDITAYNCFASDLDLGIEILSLTANGNMILYEPGPDKFVEKAKYTVSENEVYAHPVIAENRIFTKGTGKSNLLTA